MSDRSIEATGGTLSERVFTKARRHVRLQRRYEPQRLVLSLPPFLQISDSCLHANMLL
jgi:hypothetical protein